MPLCFNGWIKTYVFKSWKGARSDFYYCHWRTSAFTHVHLQLAQNKPPARYNESLTCDFMSWFGHNFVIVFWKKKKGHGHFCCTATFSGSFKYETGEGRSVERGMSGFDGLQSGPKIQDGFIDFNEVCYPVQTAKKFMTVLMGLIELVQ